MMSTSSLSRKGVVAAACFSVSTPSLSVKGGGDGSKFFW